MVGNLGYCDGCHLFGGSCLSWTEGRTGVRAAIPIAIIAVGVSTATKRNKALGENVIIQSIGACSGAVVAGAIFTLPAIYILQAKYPEMTTSFMKIFLLLPSEESWASCSSYLSASTL